MKNAEIFNTMLAHLTWSEEEKAWSTKVDGRISDPKTMLLEIRNYLQKKYQKTPEYIHKTLKLSTDNSQLIVSEHDFGVFLKHEGTVSRRTISRIYYTIRAHQEVKPTIFVPLDPQEVKRDARFNIRRACQEWFTKKDFNVGTIETVRRQGFYIHLPENMSSETFFGLASKQLGIEFTNNHKDLVPTQFRNKYQTTSKQLANTSVDQNKSAVILSKRRAEVEANVDESKNNENAESINKRQKLMTELNLALTANMPAAALAEKKADDNLPVQQQAQASTSNHLTQPMQEDTLQNTARILAEIRTYASPPPIIRSASPACGSFIANPLPQLTMQRTASQFSLFSPIPAPAKPAEKSISPIDLQMRFD